MPSSPTCLGTSAILSVFGGLFRRPGTYPSLQGLSAHKVLTDSEEEALIWEGTGIDDNREPGYA